MMQRGTLLQISCSSRFADGPHNLKFALFICTDETGVVYIILLYCTDTILNEMPRYMERKAARACAWEHADGAIPSFVSDEYAVVLSLRILLWKAVRNNVMKHGTLSPLKLFRNALQVYYSNTKGRWTGRLNSG